MRRTLIAGNWKMNGCLADNAILLADIKNSFKPRESVDIAVCVPALYLAQCQDLLHNSSISLGAQDVSTHANGAFTGEIASVMLREFGCRFVIVGHSERRSYHGETSQQIGSKAVAALAAGLTPIVCVGESLIHRESGQTVAVVEDQLDAVLDVVAAGDLAQLVIAYEPVWAIGTGKTATPEMAQEVHAVLRAKLAAKSAAAAAAVQIIYGGSMKPDNARELLAMPDIDGGLIGGAALKARDFMAIANAAA
ncbi:MAG: triose-phosphate isomerase [Pseudomonadota bacterium]